jgi:hypothetical protein
MLCKSHYPTVCQVSTPTMTTDESILHTMQDTLSNCSVYIRCKTSGLNSSCHGAVHATLLHLFHESATAIYCPLGLKSACCTFCLNLISCKTVPRWKFKNEHGVILTSVTTNKSASSRERMPCSKWKGCNNSLPWFLSPCKDNFQMDWESCRCEIIS